MEGYVEVERPAEPLGRGEGSDQDIPAATVSLSPIRRSLQDHLNFEVWNADPESLWASVGSIISMLGLTTTTIDDLREQHAKPALRDIYEQCQSLLRMLTELEEILANYAKHWSASEDEVPLDPMLSRWMNDCMAIVSRLQEEVKRQAGMEGWDMVTLADALDEIEGADAGQHNALDRLHKELKAHTKQLEDFFPIMRCDLHEFLSLNLPQTSFPTIPSDHTSSRYYHYNQTTTLEQIRTSLYSLSDDLKTTQDRLSTSLSVRTTPPSQRPGLQHLYQRQSAIIQTLTELLTNHGSEWIESMLAGKMTFSEFQRLDVADIRRLSGAYRVFSRELVVLREEGPVKALVQMMRDAVGELGPMLRVEGGQGFRFDEVRDECFLQRDGEVGFEGEDGRSAARRVYAVDRQNLLPTSPR